MGQRRFMATNTSAGDTLRPYLNDMVALARDCVSVLEKQRQDERVKLDGATTELVGRIHTTMHAQLMTLEEHAAGFGGESGAAIKEAVASVAGTVAGVYDKLRKHPVSRMLRDDYTALSLAAVGYEMLHTTALALRDLPVANVALRHLREVTPLIVELTQLIPGVVVREISEDHPDADASAADIARRNAVAAWNGGAAESASS